MKQLTPEGQQIINNIAQRYNFSPDAVFSMLQSVINGNGSMAQFNHPEFGGSGQWMRGGMIMLGDMFNNNLKNSVGNLCQELANLIANQPGLIQSGSFQSQNQGTQQQSNFGEQPSSNKIVPDLWEPSVCLYRHLPAVPETGGPQACNFLTARVRKITCVMLILPPFDDWLLKRMAMSRFTIPWIIRSAVFPSNSR